MKYTWKNINVKNLTDSYVPTTQLKKQTITDIFEGLLVISPIPPQKSKHNFKMLLFHSPIPILLHSLLNS